ncbi:hypothetical protein DTO280E4_4485 [Paecilomyces variotii]|nr:hypothetical protein DTO207G8_7132 [Paecilomyces variotii]KAJ9286683.1 hypothetical protein DTO021C3_5632 [Paecilomyces variotii]KAJ9304590.1 hypothetical protein DTO217A2_5958 [Paecilomyces variotii]KAJ9359807.1 hypothetical protein DTO280E4_4485 [Paecilomyces variotii]KAJ9373046.1 hypothetical protein DTO282E5_2113 [Paecilomyces variotii]
MGGTYSIILWKSHPQPSVIKVIEDRQACLRRLSPLRSADSCSAPELFLTLIVHFFLVSVNCIVSSPYHPRITNHVHKITTCA